MALLTVMDLHTLHFAATHLVKNGLSAQKVSSPIFLPSQMNNGFAGLCKEVNTKFHWTLGVVLASWISTIGTLLLK